MMKQTALLTVLMMIFALLLAGCRDEGWYPSGEVRIEHYYEYAAATGGKQLGVTFSIHNTGKTSILSSAVTFKVRTTQREYLQTAASAVKIIPGGSIALTAAVPYLDPAEQLAPEGVSLYDTFFE
jgi:hypothetical protein